MKTITPIRNGCYVRFFHPNAGKEIKGIITNNYYIAKKQQSSKGIEKKKTHIFVVDDVYKIPGAVLYKHLKEHIPGEASLLLATVEYKNKIERFREGIDNRKTSRRLRRRDYEKNRNNSNRK